jgi:hypothetical protein
MTRDMPMSAVDWVLLAGEAPQVGDLVSADAGGMPIYRVVRIADGQAWVQADGQPQAQAAPLSRFHWKAASGAAPRA